MGDSCSRNSSEEVHQNVTLMRRHLACALTVLFSVCCQISRLWFSKWRMWVVTAVIRYKDKLVLCKDHRTININYVYSSMAKIWLSLLWLQRCYCYKPMIPHTPPCAKITSGCSKRFVTLYLLNLTRGQCLFCVLCTVYTTIFYEDIPSTTWDWNNRFEAWLN